MIRFLLGSMLLAGVMVSTAAAADKADDKGKGDKKGREAKITSVDAKNETVTVHMKDKDGKESDKTFKLAEDVEYMDSTGKVATLDIFTSGDLVLLVERDGMVKKMKNKDKPKDKGK